MNMKMEEHESENQNKGNGAKKSKPKKSSDGLNAEISDTESTRSMQEPPKDYEVMLQKYEAEVRNHIKIEQQLKLHIECVQDKLDDSEKAFNLYKKE